jgi:hypothetical protein
MLFQKHNKLKFPITTVIHFISDEYYLHYDVFVFIDNNH